MRCKTFSIRRISYSSITYDVIPLRIDGLFHPLQGIPDFLLSNENIFRSQCIRILVCYALHEQLTIALLLLLLVPKLEKIEQFPSRTVISEMSNQNKNCDWIEFNLCHNGPPDRKGPSRKWERIFFGDQTGTTNAKTARSSSKLKCRHRNRIRLGSQSV